MNQQLIDEKINTYSVQSESVWGKTYPLFDKIVNSKGLKVGVELGVAYAGHSNAMLKSTKLTKLYGVDPFMHQDGYDDPMNLPQDEFDCLHQYVLNRMSVYGQRYELLRMSSVEASKCIDEELDFIYIDADHSYEGAKNDLIAWFQKIRDGGIIGGHDYGHGNFPGIQKAIDEFFGRFHWKVNSEGEGVWWVEKRPINISFIIPAYNCEKTVVEAVESIVNGNLAEGDELIIVNDASTDGTESILESLQKRYSAIKFINHRYNRGGGAARNTAVENTNHSLLFCLDSDNVLVPESVLRLKELLISSGAEAACFEEIQFFRDNISSISHRWIFNRSKFSLADHLAGPIVPGASGNYLFTLESWKRAGGYPEFSGALDAWGFGLRQHAVDTDICVLKNSYYLHRIGIESYWVRESKKGNMTILLLQLLLPYLNLFEFKDVTFLLKELQKENGVIDLAKQPIRLKSGIKGHVGITDESVLQVKNAQPWVLRQLTWLRNIFRN